ncbi:MAG: hypothetical protein FJ025_00400 [Chloroflexi bacterium]|nr:hypothetical protein [Chloroflexota bacterium]
MPESDAYILIWIGVGFTVLGVVGLLLGRREEKGYYNSLASRRDVREYLEHSPRRPGLGALKVGGRIAIAVGIVLIALGGAFLLRG